MILFKQNQYFFAQKWVSESPRFRLYVQLVQCSHFMQPNGKWMELSNRGDREWQKTSIKKDIIREDMNEYHHHLSSLIVITICNTTVVCFKSQLIVLSYLFLIPLQSWIETKSHWKSTSRETIQKKTYSIIII